MELKDKICQKAIDLEDMNHDNEIIGVSMEHEYILEVCRFVNRLFCGTDGVSVTE